LFHFYFGIKRLSWGWICIWASFLWTGWPSHIRLRTALFPYLQPSIRRRVLMRHRRFHEQRSLTLFHVLLCLLHLTGLQDLLRDVARGGSVAWNKETAVCLHVTAFYNRSYLLTREPRLALCYDMDVGENRVRVFYGTEKQEKEKDSRYTGGISPCSRTVYQTCNIMYICNTLYSIQSSSSQSNSKSCPNDLIFYWLVALGLIYHIAVSDLLSIVWLLSNEWFFVIIEKIPGFVRMVAIIPLHTKRYLHSNTIPFAFRSSHYWSWFSFKIWYNTSLELSFSKIYDNEIHQTANSFSEQCILGFPNVQAAASCLEPAIVIWSIICGKML